MKSILKFVAVLAVACLPPTAHAALKVFACEPEWGSLVSELAGDRADVYVATTALQDVHRIQARPSLIARARNADLVVCTGADLEIGWLPMVLRQSGNAGIQIGRPGYLEIAAFVPRIEVPAVLDRALGDVHPKGNPHVQFGPRQVQLGAVELTRRLIQLDPGGEGDYRTRASDFSRRWSEATTRWAARGAPLKGVRVVQYHKNFSYLFDFLGMVESGTLEPKPGVEPTSSHLNDLLAQQKTAPAAMVIRSSYHPDAPAQWLASRLHVASIVLPASVGGTDRAKDLFSMYDDAIQRMLDALAGNGR